MTSYFLTIIIAAAIRGGHQTINVNIGDHKPLVQISHGVLFGEKAVSAIHVVRVEVL